MTILTRMPSIQIDVHIDIPAVPTYVILVRHILMLHGILLTNPSQIIQLCSCNTMYSILCICFFSLQQPYGSMNNEQRLTKNKYGCFLYAYNIIFIVYTVYAFRYEYVLFKYLFPIYYYNMAVPILPYIIRYIHIILYIDIHRDRLYKKYLKTFRIHYTIRICPI